MPPLGSRLTHDIFGGGGGSTLVLPTQDLVMNLRPEDSNRSGANLVNWESSFGPASLWTPAGGAANNAVYSATGFAGQPGISFNSSRYLVGDATHARTLLRNVGWALSIMAVRIVTQTSGDYLVDWSQGDSASFSRYGSDVNPIYFPRPRGSRQDVDGVILGAASGSSMQNVNLLLVTEIDYAGTRLIRQAYNSVTLTGSAVVLTAGLTQDTNSLACSILARGGGVGGITDAAALGEFSLWTAASKPATSPLAQAMAFYGAKYGIEIT